MSEINFIACDDELEEMINNGENCRFNKKVFRTMKKKKNISVNELYYPSIRQINGGEVKKYGIIKKYVYALYYRWQNNSINALLDYFARSMKKTEEIEFWSIWLGNDSNVTDVKKRKVLINQLNYTLFEKFCDIDSDMKCLRNLNDFYQK